MRRTDATARVILVCAVSLRLSQAKTPAALVAAAMRVDLHHRPPHARQTEGLTPTGVTAVFELSETGAPKWG